MLNGVEIFGHQCDIRGASLTRDFSMRRKAGG